MKFATFANLDDTMTVVLKVKHLVVADKNIRHPVISADKENYWKVGASEHGKGIEKNLSIVCVIYLYFSRDRNKVRNATG